MKIDILLCREDDTQILEQREVPEDYLSLKPPRETKESK